jgi:hypothetical protein
VSEAEHERQLQRQVTARVALPLAVGAVLIALVVAGLVYLELSQQTKANRKLSAAIADQVDRNRQLAVDLAKVQAAQNAEQRASARAQVDSCFARIRQGPALARLLVAVKPTVGDDLEAQRVIDDYIASIVETSVTRRECVALADELGVPRP